MKVEDIESGQLLELDEDRIDAVETPLDEWQRGDEGNLALVRALGFVGDGLIEIEVDHATSTTPFIEVVSVDAVVKAQDDPDKIPVGSHLIILEGEVRANVDADDEEIALWPRYATYQLGPVVLAGHRPGGEIVIEWHPADDIALRHRRIIPESAVAKVVASPLTSEETTS